MPRNKAGISLIELNKFLGVATKSTYASGMAATVNEETGFRELSFKDGDLSYRDSYCGFFRSWGRETVWHKGKAMWAHHYGGGMEENMIGNTEFANQTFDFLKKALSSGEKGEEFQPRGPNSFKDGEWEYACKLNGDISKFNGTEEIKFKGKLVFTHTFFGGLVIHRIT